LGVGVAGSVELCPIPSRGHFRDSGISPFWIPGHNGMRYSRYVCSILRTFAGY
jgi:hypothetical protein